MGTLFSKTFHVGWADVDFNAHMQNTAYLDKAVDVRLMYFVEQGFGADEFARLRLGPVVRQDVIDYYRELRLLEPVTITLALAGLSEDASHFRLRNEFFRADGKLAARLTSSGGWLDLEARRLTRPPAPLIDALSGLARSDDFAALPSSLK